MKECKRCQTEKPDDQFRESRKSCRQCESIIACDWAKNNRQKKRESNNKYHKSISALRAERTAKWRAANPLSYKAHIAVQTAVRNGKLLRLPCQSCGATGSHAHHEDYMKPLNVKWLCHTCHMIEHAMLAARKEGA
jgi:hypothetical protein